MKINLTPKDLADSEIVRIGDKATVVYHKNANGSVLTFPVCIEYPGTDNDFRIDYYEELVRLTKEGKIPKMRIIRMDDSENSYVVDEDTYEAVKILIDYAETKSKEDRKKIIKAKLEQQRIEQEEEMGNYQYFKEFLMFRGKNRDLAFMVWFLIGSLILTILRLIIH